MSLQEQPPTAYISYNGLSRRPMVWGIPYMTGLAVFSGSMLSGLFFGNVLGGAGWLVALVGIPILLFVKTICTNDDRAVEILLLETKWLFLKKTQGNASFHGGTMAIAPTNYGRKFKNVKRYFKKTVRG